MAVIGVAQYLIEVLGVDDSTRALDKFQKSAEQAGKRTTAALTPIKAQADQLQGIRKLGEAFDPVLQRIPVLGTLSTMFQKSVDAIGKMAPHPGLPTGGPAALPGAGKPSPVSFVAGLFGGGGGGGAGAAGGLGAIAGPVALVGVAFLGMQKAVEGVTKAFEFLVAHSVVLQGILGAFSDIFGALIDIIVGSFLPVITPFISAFADLIPFVIQLVDEFKPLAEEIGRQLIQFFKDNKDNIDKLVGAVVTLIETGFLTFMQTLVSLLPTLTPLLTDMANAFVEMLPDLRDVVHFFADLIASGVAFNLRNTLEILVRWTEQFAEIVAEVEYFLELLGLIDRTTGEVAGNTHVLNNAWSQLLNLMYSTRFTDIFNPLANSLLDALQGALNQIIDATNAISETTAGPILPPVQFIHLERGGEVLKTGLAVVHRGEVFSGVGGGGRMGGDTYVNLTNEIHVEMPVSQGSAPDYSESDLQDLFTRLGEISGQRAISTLRSSRS